MATNRLGFSPKWNDPAISGLGLMNLTVAVGSNYSCLFFAVILFMLSDECRRATYPLRWMSHNLFELIFAQDVKAEYNFIKYFSN